MATHRLKSSQQPGGSHRLQNFTDVSGGGGDPGPGAPGKQILRHVLLQVVCVSAVALEKAKISK